MQKYLIPPQTRTLFFISCYDNQMMNKTWKKVYNNDDFSKIKFRERDSFDEYKFRLNLPAIEVENYVDHSYFKKWRLWAINDNNKKCYAPFPNIYSDGRVCIDEYNGDFKNFFNKFYNYSFNFSLTSNLYEYIPLTSDETLRTCKILLFYKKWQEEGNLNLIETL